MFAGHATRDQGPCSSSQQDRNNLPLLFLLVCKATYNSFLSLWRTELCCDSNWSFSPRSSITATACRLLTPLSQWSSSKAALLGEIPSLAIKISSLKKKSVLPTQFAWRQKLATYFFPSYPFLSKKRLSAKQLLLPLHRKEGKQLLEEKKIWKEVVALTSRLEGSVERKASQSGREVAQEKHYADVHTHMQMQIYQGLVRRR